MHSAHLWNKLTNNNAKKPLLTFFLPSVLFQSFLLQSIECYSKYTTRNENGNKKRNFGTYFRVSRFSFLVSICVKYFFFVLITFIRVSVLCISHRPWCSLYIHGHFLHSFVWKVHVVCWKNNKKRKREL